MIETHLHVGRKRIAAEIFPIGGRLGIRTPYDPDLLVELKSLKGRRWDPANQIWTATDCPRNRFALRLLARDPAIEERYNSPLVPIESERDLFPAQAQLEVPHLVQRRRCILAADMGLGKTLSAIEAMERVACDAWLWVGLAKSLPTIRREFAKWRARVVPRWFWSYDELRLHMNRLDRIPRGVVFDESVYLKSPKASRTEVALALVEAMEKEHGDDYWMWLLSGYPTPQAPTDWWAQAEVAQPGFLREPDWWRLQERLAELEEEEVPIPGLTETRKFKRVKAWREDEVALLGRRLEGLVLVLKLDDHLDLPAKVYDVIECPPSEEMRRTARALLDTAAHGGEALRMLRELSDGFVYRWEDGKRVTVEASSPKDEKLREQLGFYKDAVRVIVFGGFQGTIDRVTKLCLAEGWSVIQLDGRGWRYQAAKGRPARMPSDATFQDLEGAPEPIAFVAHPASGGRAFTLTGSPVAIFYSNDFNGDTREQAEGRIRRPGCRGTRIVDLDCLPTDAYVRKRLREKADLVRVPLEELRRILT